jgi:hypothetical protein
VTQITIHRRAGAVARASTWVRRRQGDLSDRVHAAADERARRYAWEITGSTGRFGFGARTYRDPRFDGRRQQLSHGTARLTGRDHSQASLEGNRPAHDPDAAPDISLARDAPVGWPDDPRAKTGPAEDQRIGWSQTSECPTGAAHHEHGRKAGE